MIPQEADQTHIEYGFPVNQDFVLLLKIWIRSSFELFKLKSKNGLL